MANPFDKFDAEPTAANPFDQFDTPAPPKREADSFLSRAATGLADPIYGAAQIADKVLVNPIRQAISPGATSMDDVIRQRDAEYNAPEGFDAARMVGNVANPVTWAGPGKGRVFSKTAAALAARPVTNAAATGAVQAVLAPTNPDENFAVEKAKQAGLGAAGGAVLSKVLHGFAPTREAKALMDQGIQPSFGQSMGGVANQIEQKTTSIPLVGDAVSFARNRAQREFQEKALARATGGAPKTLDEANAYASQLYERVVPSLKPTREALQNVWGVLRSAGSNPELTMENQKILSGLVQKHFDNFGQLDGKGLKKLDSELGYLARKYAAGDPASRTLSDEIFNMQGAFRTGLEHGLPPDLQGKLQSANQTYARLIPINKAASQRTDEKLMPRAFQKALARQQRTDITRVKPDSLVDNAVSVLPSNVPDSGTAGRLMLGGGGLVGAGALGMLPAYLGAGAVAGIGATRPVQRALVGNTRPQKMLQPFSPAIAAAMAAALRGKGGSDDQ